MGCVITDGTTLDCKRGIAGVNRIWLANFEYFKELVTPNIQPQPVDDDPVNHDPLAGAVIDFTLTTPLNAPGNPPYQPVFFQFDYIETTGLANVDGANLQTQASPYFTHTVGFTLGNFTQAEHVIVEQLISSKVIALVESKLIREFAGPPVENINRYFLGGFAGGLTVNTLTGGLGQAEADLAGYTITLTGGDSESFREVWPTQAQADITADLTAITT